MADSVAPEAKTEAKTADHAKLKRMVSESQTLTATARLESQKDDDYYHGYQLTRTQKNILKRRKQPDNTWNYVRLSINGTLGVIKQGATDPRAYPKTPKDEDSADVASKVLRFCADQCKFDTLKQGVAYDILVKGTGASIIEVDDDLRVNAVRIDFEEFIYDPRSRRHDFSDARYMGIAKWQWSDDVAAKYPDKQADIEACMAGASGLDIGETQEDRPTDAGQFAWANRREKRIMVVELYYREGQTWKRCVFHGGGILEEDDSPYLDAKKRPMCPIEAQSCYVDRENNRIGLVRDMRGPQDEITKRSSKLLHELNTRQVQEISPGSGMGERDDVRREAAAPDGVLQSGWQIVPRQDIVAGQERLLQNAIQAMSRFSPNPAVLGREGENQSGRSNLIRQQAGMTEQAITFGAVEEWELRSYDQMWMRVRQYWTAPDYIRATDDEGAPTFIGVNQPPKGPDGQPLPPMPDPAQAQPDGTAPQLVENGQPAFMGPNGEKVLGYENGLAELDVDIDIDTVPDVANVQQEQFEVLVKLAEKYPQDVPFDDLLEVSTLPGKRKLLEKRKARQEQASQQQQGPEAQAAQRGMAAQVAKEEAEVMETVANTELTRAKTQTELMKPQAQAYELAAQAFQAPPPGETGAPPFAGA